MPGTLTIGLTLDPPRAVFARDRNVPSELWNQLGRNLDPDGQQLDERFVSVPLEQLLRRRAWLAERAIEYDCELDFTDAVIAFLARHAEELAEVDRALDGRAEEHDVDELLAGTRFFRPLRAFQERDLARLYALSHGANFSVPGAGKTAVAYALYEAERKRQRVSRMLVVAPLSAFDAWEREADDCLDPKPVIGRMGDGMPRGAEVTLVNYDKLTAGRYGTIAAWVAAVPCHVILDEAHRMKRGRDGERGARCLDLAHLAVRRDILSGTPAPQHPSDFYALIDFLWPSQAQRVLPVGTTATNPSNATMDRLSQRIRPLFVRTRKQELGLRRPTVRREPTDMGPLQEQIYGAMRVRAARVGQTGSRDRATLARMGAVTMYLLQAASNPGLLAQTMGALAPSRTLWPSLDIDPQSSLGEMVRDYNAHEVPAKFSKVAALVDANRHDGRKTLVWSNFPANLDELDARVLAPHRPALIHGSSEARGRNRAGELAKFREDDDCWVMLANPAAMSEGVSLHRACTDAVYIDRTFNAGQYLQSLDRIHRLGLAENENVTMTMLVSRGTIDGTVDRRLRLKSRRLAAMLRDDDLVTMALPDEEQGADEIIAVDDLDLLMHHLRAD